MDPVSMPDTLGVHRLSERALRHQALWRRAVFFGLTFLTSTVAALLMADILKVNGQTLLNALALPLFFVLFTWISGAFWTAVAGFIVRRRFEHSAHGTSHELSEPLVLTTVGGESALEFARRIVERGGVGAVVGGAPRPALAFLDYGFSASPGPSRTTRATYQM